VAVSFPSDPLPLMLTPSTINQLLKSESPLPPTIFSHFFLLLQDWLKLECSESRPDQRVSRRTDLDVSPSRDSPLPLLQRRFELRTYLPQLDIYAPFSSLRLQSPSFSYAHVFLKKSLFLPQDFLLAKTTLFFPRGLQ